MNSQSLSDDLSYIRDLAEAGRNAPLLGGRFLAWWGALATLAYLGHYAIISGMFGVPMAALAILWIAFSVLGFGGYFLMMMTFPNQKPGAGSMGNRVSATVWSGAGVFLGAFFVGVIARSLVDGEPNIGFQWSIPIVFGAYGISQLTSGVIASHPVLKVAGAASIAAAAPAVFFLMTPGVWLLAAALAGFTVLLPGLLMMRGEPSETV